MTKGAAIYGAGGHGRVVASILQARQIPILGFFDDGATVGDTVGNAPILGRREDLLKQRDQVTAVYLALGDNLIRSQVYKELRRESFELPPLIPPWAMVDPSASIADGTVVCMGALLATEVSVGRACLLNTGCCLDHESSVSDLVHVAPRAAIAGRVTIGELTFVGMAAVVAQELSVGRRVAIGANAVVLKDVADGSKVVGVHH